MKKLLAFIILATVAAFPAFAADAPDFASIADALKNASAAQPEVKDVDMSKAESSVMAYIAAVSRHAEHPSVPFQKLAQQYIWSGNNANSSSSTIRDSRGPARPYIMVGGYWDTQVSATSGGRVTLLCYVSDPDGYDDIDRVELYYGQQGTGVNLMDNGSMGDFAPQDGVFGLQFDVAPPDLLPAGRYLLELRAFDKTGNASDIWPYLTINP